MNRQIRRRIEAVEEQTTKASEVAVMCCLRRDDEECLTDEELDARHPESREARKRARTVIWLSETDVCL